MFKHLQNDTGVTTFLAYDFASMELVVRLIIWCSFPIHITHLDITLYVQVPSKRHWCNYTRTCFLIHWVMDFLMQNTQRIVYQTCKLILGPPLQALSCWQAIASETSIVLRLLNFRIIKAHQAMPSFYINFFYICY